MFDKVKIYKRILKEHFILRFVTISGVRILHTSLEQYCSHVTHFILSYHLQFSNLCSISILFTPKNTHMLLLN